MERDTLEAARGCGGRARAVVWTLDRVRVVVGAWVRADRGRHARRARVVGARVVVVVVEGVGERARGGAYVVVGGCVERVRARVVVVVVGRHVVGRVHSVLVVLVVGVVVVVVVVRLVRHALSSHHLARVVGHHGRRMLAGARARVHVVLVWVVHVRAEGIYCIYTCVQAGRGGTVGGQVRAKVGAVWGGRCLTLESRRARR